MRARGGRTRDVTAVAVVVLLLATLASACSGGEGGDEALELTVRDFSFEPTSLSVTAGEQATVRLVNEGQVVHNVTIDGTAVDVDVQPGRSVNLIFVPEAGTGAFRCKYHPDRMSGRFLVG